MKTTPFRPSPTLFRCLYLWPLVACALLTALTCAATNRTWTGGGGDNNWMTPGNWMGGVAPSPGDSLIFPGVMSGGNETNHNNYPNGTVFGSITIDTARGQDYAIGGNGVVLTNQYLLTEGSTGFGAGGAFVFFNITMSNPNDVVSGLFTITATGGLTLNDTFNTAGLDLAISNSGSVIFNGTLGNSGFPVLVSKYNAGTLTLSSSATLAGVNNDADFDVYVYEGTVVMDATAGAYFQPLGGISVIVDGAIGSLSLNGSGNSISGTGNLGNVNGVVFGSNGNNTFTPGDNGGPGTMQSDSFSPTAGQGIPSALQIIINGNQPGAGYGQMLVSNYYSLGSSFSNQMVLAPQWNYTPQIGDSFQVLTQESLEPYLVASNYFFAGLPPNCILDLTNGASLGVSYNPNGVTLDTLRTATSPFVLWKGSVTGTNYGSRNWSVTNNWAQDAGPASGDVLVFSPYQSSLYTNASPPIPMPVPPEVTNDLASGTSLVALVFTGSNYIVDGNPITVTGGITNNTTGGTNVFDLDVAAAGALPLDVEPGGTFLMGAVVTGSGTVSKLGGGLLIYNGVTADAFIGTVAVDNGTLELDGSFTDGSFIVNGGMLDGTGTISAITVNSGGTLRPGDSPGVLHVDGNLAMAPGAVFTAELDGPNPGSGYDQLQVIGSVNLNGATLNLQPNIAASLGTTFLIIANNGAGTIVGTFAGLPEGAVFQVGGQYFSISYQGGFGNKNVVVTRVNPPGNLTRIRSVPPTAVELFGAGGTNATYTILANTNLTTTNWIDIGTAPANGAGSFFFYDSNTLVYPQRFYKLQPP